MNNLNKLVCTLASLTLLTILPPCAFADARDTVVTAAFIPAGYYLPFLVVENDGLLEKRGYSLELKSYQDNTQMINAFLNGHLEITAQSVFTMFPIEIEHPGTFKFIYSQTSTSYYFVVKKDSSIKRLVDLKGKKIGTWRSPTAEAFVSLVLGSVGLKAEVDYQLIKYPGGSYQNSILNNQVDCIFGADVGNATLLASDHYAFLDEEFTKEILRNGMVSNGGGFLHTRLIASNPKKARAIQDAFLEAVEIIRKEPERVTLILTRRMKMDDSTAKYVRLDTFGWTGATAVKSATETAQLLWQKNILDQDLSNRVPSLFWFRSQ